MKLSNYRRDRSEHVRPSRPYGEQLNSYEVKPGKAAATVIEYELGYGGVLVECSETRLVFKTIVLGKIDHTVLEGTPEELEPLMNFLGICYTLNTDKDFDDLFEAIKGTDMAEKLLRPLFLTTAGVMLVGTGRTRRAATAFLAETEEDIKLFMPQSLKSLVTMIELKIDSNASQEDLRALAA